MREFLKPEQDSSGFPEATVTKREELKLELPKATLPEGLDKKISFRSSAWEHTNAEANHEENQRLWQEEYSFPHSAGALTGTIEELSADTVIYNVPKRADKRIHYIDVGPFPKDKMEKYLEEQLPEVRDDIFMQAPIKNTSPAVYRKSRVSYFSVEELSEPPTEESMNAINKQHLIGVTGSIFMDAQATHAPYLPTSVPLKHAETETQPIENVLDKIKRRNQVAFSK